METVKCWCCDEFTLKGKAETGYCNYYDKPTWKSVVKKCQENVRAEWGDFCYDHCPFRCEFDCGAPCGEESPSVKTIHDCFELRDRINKALGGKFDWLWYSLNDKNEIVENYVSVTEPFQSWVNERDTVYWWYNAGWYPHQDVILG